MEYGRNPSAETKYNSTKKQTLGPCNPSEELSGIRKLQRAGTVAGMGGEIEEIIGGG